MQILPTPNHFSSLISLKPAGPLTPACLHHCERLIPLRAVPQLAITALSWPLRACRCGTGGILLFSALSLSAPLCPATQARSYSAAQGRTNNGEIWMAAVCKWQEATGNIGVEVLSTLIRFFDSEINSGLQHDYLFCLKHM